MPIDRLSYNYEIYDLTTEKKHWIIKSHKVENSTRSLFKAKCAQNLPTYVSQFCHKGVRAERNIYCECYISFRIYISHEYKQQQLRCSLINYMLKTILYRLEESPELTASISRTPRLFVTVFVSQAASFGSRAYSVRA